MFPKSAKTTTNARKNTRHLWSDAAETTTFAGKSPANVSEFSTKKRCSAVP